MAFRTWLKEITGYKSLKMIGQLIWLLGIVLVIGLGILWIFQEHFIFHPSRRIELDPSTILPFNEDLYLSTPDQETIHAWFVFSPSASKTILFCHGNAGNLSYCIDILDWGYKMGWNVLVFDYRGYGKSTGTPSEKGTYLDAETAYRYLLNRGIQDKDIVVWGRSLGGAIATEIALRQNPGLLILESTFTSIPDMATHIYPFLPVRKLCRIQYNTISKIKQIRCPVLIIHSQEDEIIPFFMGQKLYEMASSPKFFLPIHGSHNEGFLHSGDVYRETIQRFISTDHFGQQPHKSVYP